MCIQCHASFKMKVPSSSSSDNFVRFIIPARSIHTRRHISFHISYSSSTMDVGNVNTSSSFHWHSIQYRHFLRSLTIRIGTRNLAFYIYYDMSIIEGGFYFGMDPKIHENFAWSWFFKNDIWICLYFKIAAPYIL